VTKRMLVPAPVRQPRLNRRLAAMVFCAGLLAGCSETPEAMVASAKDYLAKDDTEAASIQLKNALQQDGKIAEARFLLGVINLNRGDAAGAVKELRRARELGYAAVEVDPHLARALVAAGEKDQAIKEFEGQKFDNPAAQAKILTALGDAYLANRQTDRARAAYEEAIALSPEETAAARIGLGRAKFVRGDLDGALSEAKAALETKDASAEAHALRADVLTAQNQTSDAVAALDEAVKERPDAVNYHFTRVSLLLREDDLDGAEQRLADMHKAAPGHPLTRYLQAFIDLRRNKVNEARDGAAEVVRLMPDFMPGQLLAGSIYARLNDHVRAQEHLGHVLARAPSQPLARRMLTLSFLSSGEPARALETLRPMLDEKVTDNATLTLAGQVYLANGDFAKAAEYHEKVAAAEPKDTLARTRLGVSRLAGGDADKAFDDLEAAAASDETSGFAETALVLAHMRRKEFDKALAAQAQLERKQPNSPQTYNLKGGVLLAKQDLPGARAAFEKAISLKPDFLPAAINLSRIDLLEGRKADGRRRLESFVAAHPKNVDGYLVLADLLVRTGAPAPEVRATLERAIAAGPTAVAPRVALARHHLSVKDPKRALAVAQELATAHPSDPQAIGTLARVQAAAGDQQQAISSFNRLVSLQPKSAAPLLELADMQRAVKDRNGAELTLKRALELKPDMLDAQQRLIAVMLEDRRTADALKVARTIQRQRSDSAAGHLLEADVHAAAKDWAQAAPVYQKALDRTPVGEIAIKLHAALLRNGKQAEAEKMATTWLRTQPKDVVMRSYLAELALNGKRFDEADKLYRQVVELGPENPAVLNNLAWVAGQRKDPQALSLAERAHALAPDSPAVLDTLGTLQIEQGNAEQGLANIHKAVSLAPESGVLRLSLAKAYVKLDRKDDARKEVDALLGKLAEGHPLRAEASALKQGL